MKGALTMNKILSFVLVAASVAVLFSCKSEEDDIFDSSAAERLNEVQKTFGDRLVASDGGWVMEYFTSNYNIYPYSNGNLFLMKFFKDNTVTIATKNPPVQLDSEYAEFIEEDESRLTEEFRNAFKNHDLLQETSLWEIITDNGPVLTLNSYNSVLHYLSDPAYGLEGDYEFLLIDVPEDGQFVTTKGKKRSLDIRLTRLPAGTDFEEYLDDVQGFTGDMFPTTMPNELRLHFGDDVMNMDRVGSGMPIIYPNGKDSVTLGQLDPYLVTKRDGRYYLRFRDNINNSDTTKTAREFVYDAANEKFTDVDNEENYITGYPAADFVNLRISEGKYWSMSAKNSELMSPKVAALAGEINKSFAFNTLSLRQYDDGVIWSVALLTSYQYTMTVTEEGSLKFSYVEPTTPRSVTRYDDSEALRSLLDVLNGEFEVSNAMGSAFNLKQVRFTAKSDPDFWFVLTI